MSDELVQLGVNGVQGALEAGRQRSRGLRHGRQGWAKHPCLQARIESRQLPAIRSQVVALALESPAEQALAYQPSQVVGGLSGSVLLGPNPEQRGHLPAQLAVAYGSGRADRK